MVKLALDVVELEELDEVGALDETLVDDAAVELELTAVVAVVAVRVKFGICARVVANNIDSDANRLAVFLETIVAVQ